MLGAPMQDYDLPAWTAFEGSKAIACLGLQENGKGIYTLWGIVSDDAQGHGRAAVKFGRERIQKAFELLGAHRVQSAVRADNPEYNRFIKLLGLRYEGCALKATESKHDLNIYARIN